MAVKDINVLNRAIRPFGFDRPFLAITQHDAKDWFHRCEPYHGSPGE
jgi:hypothetical protein